MSVPKGKIIAIGGNVDKGTDPEGSAAYSHVNFFESGILRRILYEMKGPESRVEVITTASMIPEEIGEGYKQAFDRLGCRNVGVMHIKSRHDAVKPEFEQRIREADGVMFTGGNQLRLSTIFGGTPLLQILRNKYLHEDFMISGTSAGAMAMSTTMIYGGESSEALLKGEVKITTGLGFVPNVIIDTHFVKRGRFGRLTQAVAGNPGAIGIGLGDDTGVLITEGTQIETIGSGLVLLFDGHNIKYSNIADIPEGSPISIENLVVHILAKGFKYSLTERSFTETAPIPVELD
ncbi:MAG: cyanophycinase [Bacteroidota bacterium]